MRRSITSNAPPGVAGHKMYNSIFTNDCFLNRFLILSSCPPCQVCLFSNQFVVAYYIYLKYVEPVIIASYRHASSDLFYFFPRWNNHWWLLVQGIFVFLQAFHNLEESIVCTLFTWTSTVRVHEAVTSLRNHEASLDWLNDLFVYLCIIYLFIHSFIYLDINEV